jgi:hypothetical protein
MGMRELHLETQVRKALHLGHIQEGEFIEIMKRVRRIERMEKVLQRNKEKIWKDIERKD